MRFTHSLFTILAHGSIRAVHIVRTYIYIFWTDVIVPTTFNCKTVIQQRIHSFNAQTIQSCACSAPIPISMFWFTHIRTISMQQSTHHSIHSRLSRIRTYVETMFNCIRCNFNLHSGSSIGCCTFSRLQISLKLSVLLKNFHCDAFKWKHSLVLIRNCSSRGYSHSIQFQTVCVYTSSNNTLKAADHPRIFNSNLFGQPKIDASIYSN